MSTAELLSGREYKYGFVTDIESDMIPRGLSEDTIRLIVAKKDEPEWMLEFRLKAYRNWLTMTEPKHWPNLKYPKIDYQDVIYYSAPKQKATKASLDEVDPKLLEILACPEDKGPLLYFADEDTLWVGTDFGSEASITVTPAAPSEISRRGAPSPSACCMPATAR